MLYNWTVYEQNSNIILFYNPGVADWISFLIIASKLPNNLRNYSKMLCKYSKHSTPVKSNIFPTKYKKNSLSVVFI